MAKMIQCAGGYELSERELAATCIPFEMLPLTPEERAEHTRLQNGLQDQTVTGLEAAEFILEVILPYRFAFLEEARAIDRAEMAQQCR